MPFDLIREHLEKLQLQTNTLLIVPVHQSHDAHVSVTRFLLDTFPGATGVYLSVNRPYRNLVQTLRKVDHTRIFFIDCVTKNEVDVPNCFFLKTPHASTMGVAVSAALKRHRPAFFIFDSVTAFAHAERGEQVIHFVRFLAQKLKGYETSSVLLMVTDGTNKRLAVELSSLCDHAIDVSEP